MRGAAWAAGIIWFLTCASLSYTRFARRPAPVIQVQAGALPLPMAPRQESEAAPEPTASAETGAENPAWDSALDSAPESSEAPPASVAPPAAALPPPATLNQAAETSPPPVVLPSRHGSPSTLAFPTAAPTPDERPQKSRSRKTAPVASKEIASGPVFEPAARCLECGAPAMSWVEVDGRRIGYCRKHYSKPERSRSSRSRQSAATAPVEPTPEAAADPPVDSVTDAGQLTAPGTQAEQESGASVQCRGRTKNGERCRRKTRDPSGFCYQHRPR